MTFSIHVGALAIRRVAAIQFVVFSSFAAALPLGAAEFIPLGFLGQSPTNNPSKRSQGSAISHDGLTIAGISRNSQGNLIPFRWQKDAELTPLDSVNVNYSVSMSADGSAITWGTSATSGSVGRLWTQQAGLVEQANYFETVGFSADGSVTAGRFCCGNGNVTRWTSSDGFTNIPNPQSYTNAGLVNVSADGSVIASTMSGAAGSLPFRWAAGDGWQSLGAISGADAYTVRGISADGSTIVGASRSGSGPYTLWRWTPDSGIASIGEATSIVGYVDDGFYHGRVLSRDGAVIAGSIESENFSLLDSFRWTNEHSVEVLPKLSGHEVSLVTDMTPDGRWFVGVSAPSVNSQIFDVWLWNEDTGLQSLKRILIKQGLGSIAENWELYWQGRLPSIAANGHGITGTGINPEGFPEGYVVYLDPLVIPEPTSAALALLALTLTGTSRTLFSRHAKSVGFNDPWR